MSQIVISSGHTPRASLKFSKNVMAFSEQGVAMLSSVLKSPRAIMAANVLNNQKAFISLFVERGPALRSLGEVK